MATTGEFDAAAFNAFEAEGWERRAGAYHDFFAPITSRAIEPLLDAVAVGPGTRLLDVATGPGYVVAAALERGAYPTGLDVAAEMVALARRLSPRARFVPGDAERLPFADGCFDAVTASFAILHVGRPDRAAAELARVLRPDGRVAITVWDAPERSRLMGVFIDAVAEAGAAPPGSVPAGPDFFRYSDEHAAKRLLAGAGLAEARVETLRFTHRLGSPAELWDGMLAGTVRMRALIEGQDAASQRRVRVAFERLLGEHAVSDGIDIPVQVKLTSARKA